MFTGRTHVSSPFPTIPWNCRMLKGTYRLRQSCGSQNAWRAHCVVYLSCYRTVPFVHNTEASGEFVSSMCALGNNANVQAFGGHCRDAIVPGQWQDEREVVSVSGLRKERCSFVSRTLRPHVLSTLTPRKRVSGCLLSCSCTLENGMNCLS